nr:RNA-directed DNA polymerase, eukaryota, reverse transcriptase zinc-binding domain protein [Tanacetum cinerariifolium]
MRGRMFTWMNKADSEYSRKKEILSYLKYLEEKIDARCATDEDRVLCINRLQDLYDIEKLEAMDMVQKAQVKWEVKGDENLKLFHGVVNSKRNS